MLKTLALAGALALALATGSPAETRSSAAYQETVMVSSWYSYGRITANGEKFNPEGLTVAHRTLPFGTRLRLTTMDGAKTVVVRVNDRGPAKWTKRDLDCSSGAARVLGFKERGVTRLRASVIS